MYVGVLQVELKLFGPTSLKERRNLVRSLKERVHHRFRVAIAEVGPLDHYTECTLGVALVSSEARHAQSMADKVLNYIENGHSGAIEVTDVQVEIL